jgi:predicted nuclease of predicted toxin-antitoxin system
VRFLIDNALSPDVARLLCKAGHDAVHVREYGLRDAKDLVITERASLEERILVSAYTDFGAILAVARKAKPSFILFRELNVVRVQDYVSLIPGSLPLLETDLAAGCVAVFRHGRIRVRNLPFSASQP